MPEPIADPPSDPGSAEVDLESPTIQAAIQLAVAEERKAGDARKEGIVTNRDALKIEKDDLKAIWEAAAPGASPDEVKAMLADLTELKSAQQAKDADMDPEVYNAAVQKAARTMQTAFEVTHQKVKEAQERKSQDQATRIEALESKVHRSFVASELSRAQLPEDFRQFPEGAESYLVDQLLAYVQPKEIQGFKHPLAVVALDGSELPGKGPGGLMGLRELLLDLRQPRTNDHPGVLPVDLSFCFIDSGTGTGTRTPPKTNGGQRPSNWWKMNAQQQIDYGNEYGAAAAKAMMAKSGLPPQAAA